MRALGCWALATLLVACGGTDERTLELVRVMPEADPACGAAGDGITMLVNARGDFAPNEDSVEPITLTEMTIRIDHFPATTRVLDLEVLGAGGLRRRVGRTAPFDVELLEDGDRLPVFMAPERGFCPTGSSAGIPRDRPLAARAGSGVLIAGGMDGEVPPAPVTVVELYDPATGAFIALDEQFEQALIGASMTTLDDGRVLVAGGAQQAYQVYDPVTGDLEAPVFATGVLRGHHAAVALAGSRVLLSGGCSALDGAGACETGSGLATSTLIDLSLPEVTQGPPLARVRIGGTALLEADGRVLLIGGVDESGAAVTTAERIDPGGVQAIEEIADAGGIGARLASGASLAALAGEGEPAVATVAVIAPGGGEAVAGVAAPLPRAGATLTALEDGRVLTFGGGDEPRLWDPGDGRFDDLNMAPDLLPPDRSGHAAVLLDDGSVLLVGGRDGDGPRGDAWIFRPDLTGPFTGGATLIFGGTDDLVVVPSDPSRVRREPGSPAHLVITAGGSGGALPADWAVVAGPQFTGLQLSARVRAEAGAAVLLGFVDERDHAAVVLAPGQPTRLYRRLGGDALIVGGCDGQIIEAGELSPAGTDPELIVEVRGSSVRATLDGVTVLTCTGVEPIGRGAVGVGPVGASGSELSVSLLTVTR